MIAYDKAGSVFALREGAELLVHDGPSEGPLWKKMLDAQIIGLGADGDQIAAITSTGTVTWFGAKSGELGDTGKVDGKVEHAKFLGAKTCVAATGSTIVVVDKGGTKTLAEHGARAIAVRPDGGVCAWNNGELVQIVGGERSVTAFGNIVSALAWHPEGFWLVGAQNKILKWDGSTAPTHVTQVPDVEEIQHIAACDKAVAFTWDDHYVAEMSWPKKDTLGDLMYPERKVEGIDFGPWPWLGVALDLGDANKHNLDAPSRLHRSDTHPGREHHSWLVRVGGGGSEDEDKGKAPQRAAAPPAREEPPAADNPGQAIVGLVIIAAIGILIYFLVK